MVEAGDTVSATLKKEFGEEALNSLEATDEEKRKIEEHINHLFKSGDKARIVLLWETFFSELFSHYTYNTSLLYAFTTLLNYSCHPV